MISGGKTCKRQEFIVCPYDHIAFVHKDIGESELPHHFIGQARIGSRKIHQVLKSLASAVEVIYQYDYGIGDKPERHEQPGIKIHIVNAGVHCGQEHEHEQHEFNIGVKLQWPVISVIHSLSL